jgi:hypothetical protein
VSSLDAFADALSRAARDLEENGAIRCAQEFQPKFLAEFKRNTPKRSGALAGSEHSDLEGGGAHAEVKVSTNLPLYASFRNDGGTIHVRHARVLTDGASFFGKQVTQRGSHYKERTVSWAGGAIGAACDEIIQRILEESGI